MKSKGIRQNELIYLFAYCIYISLAILSTSFYAQYIKGFMYKGALLACACALVFGCTQEYEKKKSLRLLFILIYILLDVFYVTTSMKRLHLVATIMFIFFAKDIHFRTICKASIWLYSALLIFIVFSSKIGIIENIIDIDDGRKREYLGFLYPLFPSGYLCNVLLLWVYLEKRQIKLITVFLLSVISYMMFLRTNSRLTFAISMFVIIIGYLLKLKQFKRLLNLRIFTIPMCLAFPLCAILSVYFAYNYQSSELLLAANRLSGNRFRLAYNAIREYGVSLFGQEIVWVGNGLGADGTLGNQGTYNYVDNVYVQILVQYGIIVFLLVVIGFCVMHFHVNQYEGIYATIILMMLAIHGLIDDGIILLHFNTFLLLLGAKRIKRLEINIHGRRGIIATYQ